MNKVFTGIPAENYNPQLGSIGFGDNPQREECIQQAGIPLFVRKVDQELDSLEKTCSTLEQKLAIVMCAIQPENPLPANFGGNPRCALENDLYGIANRIRLLNDALNTVIDRTQL
jgi:hypothetical protein